MESLSLDSPAGTPQRDRTRPPSFLCSRSPIDASTSPIDSVPTSDLFSDNLRAPHKLRYNIEFEELGVLGRGSFGIVSKVRSRKDNKCYAVKRTKRQFRGELDKQQLVHEAYAHLTVCNMRNPHIVEYHDSWEEDGHLYIQMELCSTSLAAFMSRRSRQGEGAHHGTPSAYLEEAELLTFLHQMALGLQHLHGCNLVHLDIKPENIFIQDGIFKLGDFGLARRVVSGPPDTPSAPALLCPAHSPSVPPGRLPLPVITSTSSYNAVASTRTGGNAEGCAVAVPPAAAAAAVGGLGLASIQEVEVMTPAVQTPQRQGPESDGGFVLDSHQCDRGRSHVAGTTSFRPQPATSPFQSRSRSRSPSACPSPIEPRAKKKLARRYSAEADLLDLELDEVESWKDRGQERGLEGCEMMVEEGCEEEGEEEEDECSVGGAIESSGGGEMNSPASVGSGSGSPQFVSAMHMPRLGKALPSPPQKHRRHLRLSSPMRGLRLDQAQSPSTSRPSPLPFSLSPRTLSFDNTHPSTGPAGAGASVQGSPSDPSTGPLALHLPGDEGDEAWPPLYQPCSRDFRSGNMSPRGVKGVGATKIAHMSTHAHTPAKFTPVAPPRRASLRRPSPGSRDSGGRGCTRVDSLPDIPMSPSSHLCFGTPHHALSTSSSACSFSGAATAPSAASPAFPSSLTPVLEVSKRAPDSVFAAAAASGAAPALAPFPRPTPSGHGLVLFPAEAEAGPDLELLDPLPMTVRSIACEGGGGGGMEDALHPFVGCYSGGPNPAHAHTPHAHEEEEEASTEEASGEWESGEKKLCGGLSRTHSLSMTVSTALNSSRSSTAASVTSSSVSVGALTPAPKKSVNLSLDMSPTTPTYYPVNRFAASLAPRPHHVPSRGLPPITRSRSTSASASVSAWWEASGRDGERALDVVEGDSRYLAEELLTEDYRQLLKADIFSLGATAYELCLGRPLPPNGPEWVALRHGELQDLPPDRASAGLVLLLLRMLHPDPSLRPGAEQLLKELSVLRGEQRLKAAAPHSIKRGLSFKGRRKRSFSIG